MPSFTKEIWTERMLGRNLDDRATGSNVGVVRVADFEFGFDRYIWSDILTGHIETATLGRGPQDHIWSNIIAMRMRESEWLSDLPRLSMGALVSLEIGLT